MGLHRHGHFTVHGEGRQLPGMFAILCGAKVRSGVIGWVPSCSRSTFSTLRPSPRRQRHIPVSYLAVQLPLALNRGNERLPAACGRRNLFMAGVLGCFLWSTFLAQPWALAAVWGFSPAAGLSSFSSRARKVTRQSDSRHDRLTHRQGSRCILSPVPERRT